MEGYKVKSRPSLSSSEDDKSRSRTSSKTHYHTDDESMTWYPDIEGFLDLEGELQKARSSRSSLRRKADMLSRSTISSSLPLEEEQKAIFKRRKRTLVRTPVEKKKFSEHPLEGYRVKTRFSVGSVDDDKSRSKTSAKIYYHTDDEGTTWYPDKEGFFDLEGEMQRALSRSSMRRKAETLSRSTTNSSLPLEEEQEILERRRRLLSKFRGAARLIILIRSIFTHDTKIPEDKDKEQEDQRIGVPYFNVAYYCRPRNTLQLPYSVKVIMSRPPWMRSEDDRDLVFRHVLALGFFDKYPPSTLHKMAPHLYYHYVHANRVVIRQGHMPACFYLVLSGLLLVQREEKDLKTGVMVSRRAGKLKPGETFGELALIHNIPRTATVTCKYDSELLWLHKEEFDLLLKEKAQYEWWGRSRAIEAIKEFHIGWTAEDRLECSNNAKLSNYKDNKVIVGDPTGYPDMLYFIVNGHCRMVEVLGILCDRVTLGHSLIAPVAIDDVSQNHKKSRGTVVRRYVKILELQKGQYFGCGEDLRRRYIIAINNVQCIEIPHTYLRRKGYIHWVELLKDKFQASLPSHESIFHEFVQQATWRAYKKQQITELVMRVKRKAPTKMHEVPKSIQMDEQIANWNNVLNIT